MQAHLLAGDAGYCVLHLVTAAIHECGVLRVPKVHAARFELSSFLYPMHYCDAADLPLQGSHADNLGADMVVSAATVHFAADLTDIKAGK